MNGLINGIKLYAHILSRSRSPGELVWEVFGEQKGRIPVFRRDLICDWKTLTDLPMNGRSTDETTKAFVPYVPQFSLNGEAWKKRRHVLRQAFTAEYTSRISGSCPKIRLLPGCCDLHQLVFEMCFRIGFHYVFGRSPENRECEKLLPGMRDLNSYVKRQILRPDQKARMQAFASVVELIENPPLGFIFRDSDDFYKLDEADRVSMVASDLLFSCSVQPADLVCHMLLLRTQYPEEFGEYGFDLCLNETLRLYPLSDIYARISFRDEKGWFASLVQLNRNGWESPNRFMPSRWETSGHPPQMAWGVESRRCPASEVGIAITKEVFSAFLNEVDLSIVFPDNLRHERTFPYGLPVRVNRGGTIPERFRMPGMSLKRLKRWVIERKRMMEQGEIW